QAAEEMLRRTQEERNRLEQDRKLIENEKRAAAAAKMPAASTPPAAPRSAAHYDGTYNGQMCNHFKNNRQPFCWPVALVVPNGVAEGYRINASKQALTA